MSVSRKQRVTPERMSPKDQFFQQVKETETYEKPQTLPVFKAKSNNQKTALAILNKGTPVVFLTGSAGTGKSMLAAYRAACLLKQKKIDKVFLVRPAVAVGKSIGLLPGTIDEKLAPYFAQTLAHLEKFLGAGFMQYLLEKQKIEMKPVEYLRGMSFENCLVIAEECQNFTTDEFQMMLTRIGDNCTMVYTGDQAQHDLKGNSGLEKTIALVNRISATRPGYLNSEDMDQINDNIGIVQFTPDDVIRSGLTRAFVKVFYYNA